MSNILITSITRFSLDENEKEYLFEEDGCKYPGRLSCEPGVREAVHYFQNAGHLNTAILITTPLLNTEVKEINGESVTAMQYIRDLLNELEPDCKIVTVDFDNDDSRKMIVEILKKNTFHKGDRVIGDISGGLRSAMVNMMLLLNFLRYQSVEICQILSAEYQKDHSPVLKDHTEFNEIIDMINALNSFTSRGDSTQLENILTNQCKGNWTLLTGSIHTFSEDVIQARPDRIEKDLSTIDVDLNTSACLYSESFSDEMMISGGIPAIREKLNLHDNYEVPDIINWCLDNNLILQALSIYNEQIPVYLRKHNMIVPNKEFLRNIKEQKGKNQSEQMITRIGFLWKTMVTGMVSDLYFKKDSQNIIQMPTPDFILEKASEYQKKFDLNQDEYLRLSAHALAVMKLICEHCHIEPGYDLNVSNEEVNKEYIHLQKENFISGMSWQLEQLELGSSIYGKFAKSEGFTIRNPEQFPVILEDYFVIRQIRNKSIHTVEESVDEAFQEKYPDLMDLNVEKSIAYIRKALSHIADYVGH